MVLSVVASTSIIFGPAAAASNTTASITVTDNTAGTSTNHDWSTTIEADTTLKNIALNYSGTGADVSNLDQDTGSVAVAVNGNPKTVLGVSANKDVVDIGVDTTVSTNDDLAVYTTNDRIQNPSIGGTYTATATLFDNGGQFQSNDGEFTISTSNSGPPPAPYVNKSDDTYDPSAETTLSVTYNATGTIDVSDIRVDVLNGSDTLVASNGTVSTTEGSVALGVSANPLSLSSKEQVTYRLLNKSDGTLLATDTSWLNQTTDTTAPTVSNVALSESSGDMVVAFDADEQLGTSASDVTVEVLGPNGKTYTFDRTQFAESGSYTYGLAVQQAFDDGDGTYGANVTVAKDPSGNNGGTTGAGTGLTDIYDYSSGDLPPAPYVYNSDQTHDATTDTSLSVVYNATGSIKTSDIRIEARDSQNNILASNSTVSMAKDTATLTVTGGSVSGDEQLTYALFNSSSNTIKASHRAWLNDTSGGGSTGTLNGTITDAGTGTGIESATIRAFSFKNSASTTTDANGDYSLDLSEGRYAIEVTKEGYVKRFTTGITVNKSETTTQDFALETGATIRGRVTDADTGSGIQNVNVMLDGPETKFGTTNTTGYYSTNVPGGNYTVTAFTRDNKTPKEAGSVSVTDGETVTQDLQLIDTAITDVSVSYLGDSGTPDMNNISAEASLTFGMIQVRLLNDNTNNQAMPNELESLGVEADDRFEINFTVEGYDPNTLLWGAKNVSWESVDNGDGTYDVSIETETLHMEGINDRDLPIGPLQGQSIEEIAWPTGSDDSADLGWNRTVYFGLFDMSNVPSDRLGKTEGMTIATNAQTFSRPRFVERTLKSGATVEELQIYVAGPHTTVKGNQHEGFYEAFIPNAILDDWGVDDPERELQALYKGESRKFNVTEKPDGALIELDITYSDGRVQLSADEQSNFTVAIDGTNSPVLEGDTLDVDATITNDGTATGTQTVNLSLDSTEVDTQSVTLDAGESTSITLQYTTEPTDVGDRTAAVASENETASTAVSVEDSDSGNGGDGGDGGDDTTQDSSKFEVTISDGQVSLNQGETLTLSVTVENTGTGEGTQTLTATVDGSTVHSTELTLGSGESASQTINTLLDQEPGTYTVVVSSENDSDSTTVEIRPRETDDNETGDTESGDDESEDTTSNEEDDESDEGRDDSAGDEADDTTEETDGSGGEDTGGDSDGSGPGFGIVTACLAVLLAAIGRSRRSDRGGE